MKAENTKQKVGILGGSFDPIHIGHVNIAQSAYEEYGLDEVWFIPSGHSPNKDETKMTPAWQRAKMVELAIDDYPYFHLNSIELDMHDKSYTYVTLTRLKEMYPHIQFYFIMGADSLDYFEKWYHPEIICQKAILLVAVRQGFDLSAMQEKIHYIQTLFPAEIYLVSSKRTDISSTELRNQQKNQMLPEKTFDYIKQQGLYGYGNK